MYDEKRNNCFWIVAFCLGCEKILHVASFSRFHVVALPIFLHARYNNLAAEKLIKIDCEINKFTTEKVPKSNYFDGWACA